jgi:4-amino-4-deoxy-L-arabinose transferase-like glycosyltransferase
VAYAPPPGWGAPYGPTAGPAPIRLRDHPRATTALILAFVSLLICQVLSPVAWVLGHGIVKEIDANDRWSWNNRGSAAVARVLGIVGTIVLALVIAAVALLSVTRSAVEDSPHTTVTTAVGGPEP